MFRKFLAGFFASIFVVVAMPVVFLLGLYDTLGDKDFYVGRVAESSYDFLLASSPVFFEDGDLAGLSDEAIREIVGKIMTPEDFRSVVGDIYDSVVGAKIENGNLDLLISLDWFLRKKDTIVGEIAGVLYDESPVEGVAKIDYQARMTREMKNDLFANVPSEFVLKMEVPEGVEGNLMDYFGHVFDLFMSAVGMFLSVLLLLVGLLIFSPWFKVLMLEFKTIFMAALFTMLSLLFLLLIGRFIAMELSVDVGNFDELYLALFQVLVPTLFIEIFFNLVFHVGAILILSLVVWILFIRYSKHNESS